MVECLDKKEIENNYEVISQKSECDIGLQTLPVKTVNIHKYFELKNRLFFWMAEVIFKLQWREETLFLAVYLLDEFLSNTVSNLKEAHLLSIACIFISVKLQEVNKIKVDDVVEYIGHRYYTRKEILKTEMKILKLFKFKIPIHTSNFKYSQK